MKEVSLAEQFDEQMLEIYRRADTELKYKATIFLRMLMEHKGVETAKRLINASGVSDGYTFLWKHKRLDLNVEAMVLENPKWHPLFTVNELMICRERLQQYEYQM